MILPKSRCGSCLVDNKCLANGVIYFSFLMPLHQRAVYEFVIGCSTGQSYFVAIEQRCQCLIWASVPCDTLLAGYCLFEVLIDCSSGGNFPGCQYVIDHLFRSFRISNSISLNRIPYAIKMCPSEKPKITFVSTLKKIFQTDTFSNLIEGNRDKFDLLRQNERRDLKHNMITKDEFIQRRRKHRATFKNIGEACPEGMSMIRNKVIKTPKKVISHVKKSQKSVKQKFTGKFNKAVIHVLPDKISGNKVVPMSTETSLCLTSGADTKTGPCVTDKNTARDETNTGTFVTSVKDGRESPNRGAQNIEVVSAFNVPVNITANLLDTNNTLVTTSKTHNCQTISEAPSSSITLHCTSTSNTERINTPRLITSLQSMEVRHQAWTPTTISKVTRTNKSNNSNFSEPVGPSLLDWNHRLHHTIEKYLSEDVF